MKKITLLRLTMENFKGCASRTFEFDGRDAVIYGANGTGKTTVYNALTWLLFDKVAGDGGTVMTAPDIKPNGADGEVADHTAISSVEAAFSVDDGMVTLRREYKEVWEAKRGRTEKTMNGHTSNYFWNGVPVQLQDFKARLSETLAAEDLFWALSNVHWFGRGMDWKARRTMLADVCGLQSDAEILAANAERFPGLADAMREKNLSLDDYRKFIADQRNKLEKARNGYPISLKEVRRSIQLYDKTDFNALRVMCSSRETEIQQCTEELAKLENGTLIASTRNELESVRNKARELELENQRYRQGQTPPPDNRRPELEKNLQQWQTAQADAERRVTTEQSVTEQLDRQLQTLRNNYRAFNPDGLEIQQRVANLEAETFKDAVCPTCGQILPPAAQEKAKQQFDADKERRKGELIRRHNDMCNRANELKADREAAQKRKEEAEQAAENARQNVASVTDELQRLPAAQMRIVNDLPNYANDMAGYNRQIEALQGQVASLEAQSAESRNALNADLARLRWEKSQLDEQIAGEKVLEDCRKREEELLEAMSNAAEELSALDKWRDMAEAFTRFKVEAIESGVNEHFQTVRFKLFQPQVNGGLKDCCDVYVGGGRLDHGLNTGAEYNAGIDVINALSEHYGIRVPLFVDGAESVSELLPIDTQIIRLVVSRDDKELRMEVAQ